MKTYLCVLALLIALTSASLIQDNALFPPQQSYQLGHYPANIRPYSPFTSLKGDYVPSIQLNPNLIVKLGDFEFTVLNGCNEITGRYAAHNHGSISFDRLTATKKFCETDFDSVYINAFSSAAYYQRKGKQVILKNSRRAEILTLTLVGDQTPVTVTPVFLTGTYTTNIEENSKVKIQFTESGVRLFGGCNTQNAQYKAYTNGTLAVGIFTSTKVGCINDNDYKYTNALCQTIGFMRGKDRTITLLNSQGNAIMVLSSFSPPVTFDNTYKAQLNYPHNGPNKFLLLKFDSQNRVSILNACNNHRGNYEAREDGQIKFGPMASTKKFCPKNDEAIYINALKKSVRFKQYSNGRIAFWQESGLVELRLTPHKVVQPQTPITNANLCQNVKCKPSTRCVKGKCITNPNPLSLDINKVQVVHN